MYPLKKTIIFIIALVVLSGCTQKDVRVDSANGLVINEFSADPVIAEPDDIVRFFVDFENVGGTTAECVKAELYGVESWYDIHGMPLTLAPQSLWFSFSDGRLQICYSGLVKGNHVEGCLGYDRETGLDLSVYIQKSWNEFSSSQYYLAYCSSGQNPIVKYWPDMAPPYPYRNRPGQFYTADFMLMPPVLPEGSRTDYTVTVRLSYFYKTSSTINIRAFSKAEYKRRQDIGEVLDYPAELKNSDGPIKVAIKKVTSPIVVNERLYTVSPYKLVPLTLEFQNVGNGWPLPVATPESGFIFGSVELRGPPGTYFYDCLGQQGLSTEIFIRGPLAKLRSDKTAPFGCTIALDRSQWLDRDMGTISLVFNLWYRYYTDKETTVTVMGAEPGILR